MPKKHRVKRANYVKYLLEVEKKREAYIDKRKNRKRGRAERNEEDVFDAATDMSVQSAPKKRRADPATVAAKQEEEEKTTHTTAPAAVKVNPFASLQAQTGADVSGGFFDVSQVAPTTTATAPATTEGTSAKKKAASKKKY